MSARRPLARQLTWRLLGYRRRAFLGLAGTAAVVVAVLTIIVGWYTSAGVASRVSTVNSFGGHQFAVQVNDSSANPVLARIDGAVPLAQITAATVTASNRTATATVIEAPVDVMTRSLTEGTAPRALGEVALPRQLAADLEVDVGDTVSIGGSVGRVVGVSVDPGNRWDQTVHRASAAAAIAPRADRWLLPSSPWENPELTNLLDTKVVEGSSLAAAEKTRQQYLSRFVTGVIRYTQPTTLIIGLVIVVTMATGLGSRLRRDVLSLQAAGVTLTRACRVVAAATGVAVLAGCIGGLLVGVAALLGLRQPLSASIDQRWLSISVNPVFVVAAVTGFGLLAAAGTYANVRWSLRAVKSVSEPRPAPRIVLATMAVAALAFLTLQGQTWADVNLLPFALSIPVAAALSSFAGLGTWLILRRSRRASRVVAATLSLQLVVVAAVAGPLICLTSYFAAAQTNSTYQNLEYYRAQQPLGSFVVMLNASSTDQVLQTYRDKGGGSATVWDVPNENNGMTRVASPAAVGCLRNKPTLNTLEHDDCFSSPDAFTTLSTIALDTANPLASLRAGREVVQGGQAGLLAFPSTDSYNSSPTASSVRVVPADVDEALGGLLPAGVVGAKSPLAAELGLRPSGRQIVVLLDFGRLARSDQASLRAAVQDVAPASEYSELLVPEDENVRRLGLVVAISGAVIVSVMLLAAVNALWTAHRDHWVILRALANPRARVQLVTLWLTPLILCVLVATALGRWLGWFATPHNGLGLGWEWSLPGLTGILTVVLLATAKARRLRSPTESLH